MSGITYESVLEHLKSNIPCKESITLEIAAYVSNLQDINKLVQIVSVNPYTLAHVKSQTPEICLVAVNQNPLVLDLVPDQTHKICLAAIQEWGTPIHLVRNKTPELCLAAVKAYGRAIMHIENQTPEICAAAIQQDPFAFAWINEEAKTPEICLAALQQCGILLRDVKKQTLEICLAAVLNNVQYENFASTAHAPGKYVRSSPLDPPRAERLPLLLDCTGAARVGAPTRSLSRSLAMNARLPTDSPSVGSTSARKKGSPAKNPARVNNSSTETACPFGCEGRFRLNALVSHLNSTLRGDTNRDGLPEQALRALEHASIALCSCGGFCKTTMDVNSNLVHHGNHKCRADPKATGGKAKAAPASQAGKSTGTREQPGTLSSQGDLYPTDAEASPIHTPKAKPQKQRGSRGKGKGSKRSGQASRSRGVPVETPAAAGQHDIIADLAQFSNRTRRGSGSARVFFTPNDSDPRLIELPASIRDLAASTHLDLIALKVGLGPHEIQGLTGRGAFEHHTDSLPGMNPTPRCAG
jgi:hypothetical protein